MALNNPRSHGVDAPSSQQSSSPEFDSPAWLPQLAKRYLHVEDLDPVRRTLNRGLLIVIVLLTLASFCLALFALSQADMVRALSIGIGAIVVLPLSTYLARHGGDAAAYSIALSTALANSLLISPSYYAEPVAVLAIFLLPPIIAALFARPLAGFALVFVQTSLLAFVLYVHGASVAAIRTFATYFLLDMLSTMAPIIVAAWIMTVSLRKLATINQELDQKVLTRTEEIQRIMALREKEISAVVHDINNRMIVARASIDELSTMALIDGAVPEAISDAERRVNAAMDAVGYLVDDLRTAVLLDNDALQLNWSSVDAGALLRAVIEQFRSVALLDGCQLYVNIPEEASTIWGDAQRLDRVFANLIDNALKYTRRVPRKQRAVKICLQAHDDPIVITIIDSGPGLDDEALALLGRPFTRFASSRGTDGMGVGIYITRGLVELHHGTLTYASAGPGTGTTVTLSLPRRPPSCDRQQPGDVSQEITDNSQKTISRLPYQVSDGD
jgi:signal transduction histidine kinase